MAKSRTRRAGRGGDEPGHEAEESPYTKGPCEHGVKYRSHCKVCSACPHGKWRRLCKECGGAQSASTVVSAHQCKECGGVVESASTVAAPTCKECVVSNLRARPSQCKECGAGICEHGRRRSQCKECGGISNLRARSLRSTCKECGGSQSASTVVSSAATVRGVRWCSICEHGRKRSKCKA